MLMATGAFGGVVVLFHIIIGIGGLSSIEDILLYSNCFLFEENFLPLPCILLLSAKLSSLEVSNLALIMFCISFLNMRKRIP